MCKLTEERLKEGLKRVSKWGGEGEKLKCYSAGRERGSTVPCMGVAKGGEQTDNSLQPPPASVLLRHCCLALAFPAGRCAATARRVSSREHGRHTRPGRLQRPRRRRRLRQPRRRSNAGLHAHGHIKPTTIRCCFNHHVGTRLSFMRRLCAPTARAALHQNHRAREVWGVQHLRNVCRALK